MEVIAGLLEGILKEMDRMEDPVEMVEEVATVAKEVVTKCTGDIPFRPGVCSEGLGGVTRRCVELGRGFLCSWRDLCGVDIACFMVIVSSSHSYDLVHIALCF